MVFQLLIIQAVTFIGLIIVLRILFYRQLSSALARLRKLHEENLAREEELKKELENAKKEKEAEMIRTKAEAEAIIKESRTKAEKLNEESRVLAKQEADKIIEQGKTELRKLEAELSTKYQEEAIEFSVSMLKFTFSQKGKEALQHELLSELIKEIEGLDPERFSVKTKQAKILAPAALSPAEKEKLSQLLSQKIGQTVELQESVDPDIIAGIIIQVGALTIDGSLRNKLKKVIPYLKTEQPAAKPQPQAKAQSEENAQ